MAAISRRMLNFMMDKFSGYKTMEKSDMKESIQLIYNAGYRAGLKARTEDKTGSPIPGDLEEK